MWNEYLHLITDPAHLLLELTMIFAVDVVFALMLWPLIKRAVVRHDHKFHKEDMKKHRQEQHG